MARSRSTGLAFINILGRLPWWVCFLLAIVVYLSLSMVATQGLTRDFAGKPINEVMTQQVMYGLALVGQYVLPILLILGGILNIERKFKRGRLFHVANIGDKAQAISQIGWREFELLIGEAFRRRGYTVKETGQNGNDGGVDLILKKEGTVTVVQCKHWKAFKVGVEVVRAHLGTMINEAADQGIIVTSGKFTQEARTFAVRHGIELIDGPGLAALLRPAIDRDYLGRTANGALEGIYANGRKLLLWKASTAAVSLAVCLIVVGGGAWLAIDQINNLGERMVARAKTSTNTPPAKPQPTKQARTDTAVSDELVKIDPVQSEVSDESASESRRMAAIREFEAQYEQPGDCLVWRDEKHMIDCGNRYIQARDEYLENRNKVHAAR